VEGLLTFFALVIGLVILDLLALRFGTDSRRAKGVHSDERRSDWW
jgi:hypothetical protein